MTESVPVYQTINRFNTRTKVINDINRERERQTYLHGYQEDVSLELMYVVLAEEFGEVAQALQVHNSMANAKETDQDNLYKELIHTAAVAVKMAERLKGD